MSTTDVQRRGSIGTADITGVDMKVEVIVIPVADVDRATPFYRRLGWRLDVTPPTVVQFTPHGSACSVQFGRTLTSAAPGSGKGYLVVATRTALVGAGVDVSEIFHIGPDGPVSGPDPEHRSYFSRATFADPDGNEWLLQEITTRLRAGSTPKDDLRSVNDLAAAFRRAAAAHGEHEKRTGQADPTGRTGTPPTWCRQAGTELPT